jgi:hypothetical protein
LPDKTGPISFGRPPGQGSLGMPVLENGDGPVIYYMECSQCGQQFKSSSDDIVLDLGPISHIEDAGE